MAKPSRSTKTDKWGQSARYYEIDGVGRLPSVTTVLSCAPKGGLLPWAVKLEREYVTAEAAKLYAEVLQKPEPIPAAFFQSTLTSRLSKTKEHTRVLDTATEIGTRIHALCEMHSVDQKAYENAMSFVSPESPEGIALKAWEVWSKQHNVRPIKTEQVVYHTKHRVAGCYDLLAWVDDQTWLIDFKSSSGVYESMFWQLGMYGESWFDMGHGLPDVEAVVRLPKAKGDKIEVKAVPNHDEAVRGFLSCLQLWKILNDKKVSSD